MKAIGNLPGYLIMDPFYRIYFSDDVLLFVKVFNSQTVIISNILNHFSMFFGLKVNVAKSKVFFSATTKRSKMDLIVSNIGIKRTLTLEKYVSFPLLHGHLQRKEFESLEEKISQRLVSW